MNLKFLSTLAALSMPLAASASDASIYDIPLKDIDGKETTLAEHKGKALLIVNVASECGYTSQYAGLQALHEAMKDEGLVVLGFPCNDFGGQEPGSEAEIKSFCTARFKVTFPMYSKVKIAGEGKDPLFAALTGQDSPHPGEVGWNFEKFLIGTDGKLAARFDSGTEPDSPELSTAIKEVLSK